jgi:hypothetical protein
MHQETAFYAYFVSVWERDDTMLLLKGQNFRNASDPFLVYLALSADKSSTWSLVNERKKIKKLLSCVQLRLHERKLMEHGGIQLLLHSGVSSFRCARLNLLGGQRTYRASCPAVAAPLCTDLVDDQLLVGAEHAPASLLTRSGLSKDGAHLHRFCSNLALEAIQPSIYLYIMGVYVNHCKPFFL